jgi:hypothetical protein
MKSKIIILGAVLSFAASSLFADISNTNAVTWSSGNVVNTSYNWTGNPYDALSLKVTVADGYQFDFNSLGIFLSYSGAGSGGPPSPYLQIVDSGNNVIATTPSVLMTTSSGGLFSINGRASANPFEITLTEASTVSLSSGTYDFQIWDTGEQLNFLFSGGAVSVPGIDVNMGTPYPGDFLTPAFEMSSFVEAPVPEPATYALMGLGALGVFLTRRARHSNA